VAFTLAEAYHIVNCFGIIGLLTGSVTHASNADKARRLMGDINGMVNYITRSYDGDGLVAMANQYYPKSTLDSTGKTKPLLTNVLSKEDYLPVNANHKTIETTQTTYDNIKTLFKQAGLSN